MNKLCVCHICKASRAAAITKAQPQPTKPAAPTPAQARGSSAPKKLDAVAPRFLLLKAPAGPTVPARVNAAPRKPDAGAARLALLKAAGASSDAGDEDVRGDFADVHPPAVRDACRRAWAAYLAMRRQQQDQFALFFGDARDKRLRLAQRFAASTKATALRGEVLDPAARARVDHELAAIVAELRVECDTELLQLHRAAKAHRHPDFSNLAAEARAELAKERGGPGARPLGAAGLEATWKKAAPASAPSRISWGPGGNLAALVRHEAEIELLEKRIETLKETA